ncbi:hypothetical protein ABW19_dt0203413 [Dactylella cylindrospora]|nr:hypothetical protein ABW19_dt0203413 [Dactylella cylindrospora]
MSAFPTEREYSSTNFIFAAQWGTYDILLSYFTDFPPSTFSEQDLAEALETTVIHRTPPISDYLDLRKVTLLLSHGAAITPRAYAEVLAWDAPKGPRILQEFINHGWDINSRPYGYEGTIVHEHSRENRFHSVKWVVERGGELVDYSARNPRNPGPERGLRKLVQPIDALLERYKYTTPLLEFLIRQGAEITRESLYIALRTDFPGLGAARTLLENGADPNVSSGETFYSSPLFGVIISGGPVMIEKIELLLEFKADIYKKGSDGMMAMNKALQWGRNDAYLLLAREDMIVVDSEGDKGLKRKEEMGKMGFMERIGSYFKQN